MVNAQEWLEKNYLDKEETYNIYINQQLEGVLDCREYKNLRYITLPIINDSFYINSILLSFLSK